MLTFDEARARILADVARRGIERVDLTHSLGRVLAAPAIAHAPLPPFDYSAMDGWVVARGDLAQAGPHALPARGECRAGGEIPARVEPGAACRIFTGAVIPPRGDAVIMQEDVTVDGDLVRFARTPRVGEHIRHRGEDIAAGTTALEEGTRLAAHHIAMLATLDRSRVDVARRPVVSILSTGDELREPGERDRPGSVVDSNGPALGALVTSCGGIARRLPFASDTRDATRAALSGALDGADLVITVGGVSVGDRDVVKSVLADVGIELDFWRVAIKPGKPLAVGRAGNARFLGLPGNPASALLTFILFGAPLVRAMQGDRCALPSFTSARLAREFRHATGRLEFARARLKSDGGVVVAEILANQASGAVTSFAWADGLVLIPDDVEHLEAGASVRVLRFIDV